MKDTRIASIDMAMLAEQLQQMGESVFAERYDHPFLIVVYTPPREDDDEEESTVRTVTSGIHDLQKQLSGVPGKQVVPLALSGRGRLRDRVVAGRLDSCDIIIRANKISRQHAVFFKRRGFWYLEDLGSANGTKLNGSRLQPGKQVQLKSGDMVALWRFLFQFVEPEPFRVMLRSRG